MSNKFVNDTSVRVLLDRREEIKNQINKLQAEYKAIEDMIRRDYNRKYSFDLEDSDYER